MSAVINGQGRSAFQVWKAWQRLQFKFKISKIHKISRFWRTVRAYLESFSAGKTIRLKNWVVRVQKMMTNEESQAKQKAMLSSYLSQEIRQNLNARTHAKKARARVM